MDFSQHYAMNWYQDQQKKKENNYQKGQISSINRNLQDILHRLESEIDKDKVAVQEKHINRHLVSCLIWRMGYINNFESERVALEQGVFLQLILKLSESGNLKHYESQVERYMRNLGNIDWSLFLEFSRRKQAIQRITDNSEPITKAY